jgi:hypothetical protein
MNGIFYLVGLIVVALLVVYFLGALVKNAPAKLHSQGLGERIYWAMTSVRASK